MGISVLNNRKNKIFRYLEAVMTDLQTIYLHGTAEFKKQAIESICHKQNSTEITIRYQAIEAIDFQLI